MDSYLFGALSNFVLEPVVNLDQTDHLFGIESSPPSLEDEEDDFFFVHNRFCPTKQLMLIHGLYEKYIVATEKNASVMLPKSKMIFNGSKVYFKCFLKQTILKSPFCPYPDESRNYWKFFTGIVDMNSVLRGTSEDISLHVFSKSTIFLQQMKSKTAENFKPELYKDSETQLYCLHFSFTNVIDFFGSLVNSSKQREFNILLHGKGTLPKCFVHRNDARAILPSKTNMSDVGYNIYILQKFKVLNENTVLYDTGITLKIPHKYYVQIVPLPSLAQYGYMLANGSQIISRSYKGNLYIPLTRISNYALSLDDKLPFCCCQILFHRQCFMEIEESLNMTDEDMEKNNSNPYWETTSSSQAS